MFEKKKIQNIINYLTILYALLLPLSRAAIVILTVLLLILWVLKWEFKNDFYKIIHCKWTVLILIFLLFNIFALIWVEPNNIPKALMYIKKYWYLLIIFPIFTSIKKSYIKKSLYAFIIGMTLSMIESWGIYFGYHIKEVTPHSLSPHMYHVMYSVFLSFASLTSLSFAINSKNKIEKSIFIILFILFSVVMFLGVGRTGEVIYLIGLISIIVKHSNLRPLFLFSTLLIISSLLITMYVKNSNFHQRVDDATSDIEKLENGDYCTSLGARIATFVISYDIIKKHPLIGIGTIDHVDYLKSKTKSESKFKDCYLITKMDYYHGQYIEEITQHGIVGLVIVLLFFYSLATMKSKDILINDINLIFFILFLLFFIVDMPFRREFSLALFAFISSIIAADKYYQNGSN